jgi:hypothetical protein
MQFMSLLLFAACSAFSSTLTGAFDEVSINAGTTGTVVLTSVTPVSVTVNLQGITTVKVGAPEGKISCWGLHKGVLGEGLAPGAVTWLPGDIGPMHVQCTDGLDGSLPSRPIVDPAS